MWCLKACYTIIICCLLSKAQRTSKNIQEIVSSINKFALPGTSIKDYSVHKAAGFWTNVSKDLQVPNTLTNRKKKNSSGIPASFKGNLSLG